MTRRNGTTIFVAPDGTAQMDAADGDEVGAAYGEASSWTAEDDDRATTAMGASPMAAIHACFPPDVTIVYDLVTMNRAGSKDIDKAPKTRKPKKPKKPKKP